MDKYLAIYCSKSGYQLECETLYGNEGEVKEYLRNQEYITQGIDNILLRKMRDDGGKKHDGYIKV